MTITAKVNPGLVGGDRTASLDRYAARLFDNPGMAVMAVVELRHVDRIEPAEGVSDKDPQVRLRIEALEVAPPGGPEDTLREVERALYVARTAGGTLGSEDDVKLAEQTMANAAGLMSGHEVARLRVILDWLIDRVGPVVGNDKLRPADIRRQVDELLAKATAARDTGVQLDLVEGAAP